MIFGVIQSYDIVAEKGALQTTDGSVLMFTYGQGQNMMLCDRSPVPVFTGRHRQPAGFALRHPVKGDLVLFETSGDELVLRWGYVAHYRLLVRRQLASPYR